MQDESTVFDYMTRNPPAVTASTPLGEVIDLLDKHSLSGLPVVDDNDQLTGFVSEKDCIYQLIQSSYHCEGAPNTSEVMTSEAAYVSQKDSIYKVADLMVNSTRKAFPVVSEGKLVGLITRNTVLRALNDYLMACSLPSK